MKITLMRHGEAVPFAPTDAERRLTPTGRGEATRTTNQLRHGGFHPTQVLCSTHQRAIETATIVADLFDLPAPGSVTGILPEDPWQAALAVLESQLSEGTLVVFHQPILTQIVGHLLSGDPRMDVEPRAVPATAYVLSLEDFVAGGATLIAAYTP